MPNYEVRWAASLCFILSCSKVVWWISLPRHLRAGDNCVTIGFPKHSHHLTAGRKALRSFLFWKSFQIKHLLRYCVPISCFWRFNVVGSLSSKNRTNNSQNSSRLSYVGWRLPACQWHRCKWLHSGLHLLLTLLWE
jgi:hypothetical protein